MSSQPNESTSEPIYKAAASVGAGITAVLGALGALVALGVISSDQADTYTTLGQQLVTDLPGLAAAIAGVASVVTGIVASFVTAWHARKKVIPTDSDVFPTATATADPTIGP